MFSTIITALLGAILAESDNSTTSAVGSGLIAISLTRTITNLVEGASTTIPERMKQ